MKFEEIKNKIIHSYKCISPFKRYNGKWYFWDQYWLSKYGPFNSREIAKEKLLEYAKEI